MSFLDFKKVFRGRDLRADLSSQILQVKFLKFPTDDIPDICGGLVGRGDSSHTT